MAATRVSNDYLIKNCHFKFKSDKGFKITVTVLYILNGPVLEFEARRLPYLESSLITRGGPLSILTAAALRLR